MVNVLGFDIGGANTKAVFLQTINGKLKSSKVAVEYFPVWKHSEKLTDVLLTLKNHVDAGTLDGVGVTMTAELSDAYQTKREGVAKIIESVKKAFATEKIYVLTSGAKLESARKATEQPIQVAAANWAATGWLVAQCITDCVVVDVGSTSASIIPVSAGKLAAIGKTDLEKLVCGELVYTGSLRTNVAAIVQSVPVRGSMTAVSSELFALSADVHLVLGNISETQYTCETADGRGKTITEALARLARVVCADIEMLTTQEIICIARYIYDSQIVHVAEGLAKVYSCTQNLPAQKAPVIIVGLGKDFIARKAAEKIGVKSILDMGTMLPDNAALAAPAFGVALMTANKVMGEKIQWTQLS